MCASTWCLFSSSHAKHRVRQRLDHRGHHFDGVFFRIADASALLLFRFAVSCPCAPAFALAYQDGPCTSRGRVKIQGPFAVTATVCSKCAESLPSVVTAVQSSSSTFTPGPPDIHHRLDGENHAFLQARAVSRLAIIRHVGLFVHLRSDAVADKLAHHRKAVLRSTHCCTAGRNVAQPVARPNLVNRRDPAIRASRAAASSSSGVIFAHRHRHRRIARSSRPARRQNPAR